MKLHETKLQMLEGEIAEIAKKKADIEKTLSKLKKQMARNEPSPSGKEAPENQGDAQEDTKKPSRESKPADSVSTEESNGEPSKDVASTNTSVQESSDKSQPAEG